MPQLTSKQQLELDAGLAAGYKMMIKEVSGQAIVYANDMHFHPLSNFAQALQLALDAEWYVNLGPWSCILSRQNGDCMIADWRDDETKTQTICRAVVECVV